MFLRGLSLGEEAALYSQLSGWKARQSRPDDAAVASTDRNSGRGILGVSGSCCQRLLAAEDTTIAHLRTLGCPKPRKLHRVSRSNLLRHACAFRICRQTWKCINCSPHVQESGVGVDVHRQLKRAVAHGGLGRSRRDARFAEVRAEGVAKGVQVHCPVPVTGASARPRPPFSLWPVGRRVRWPGTPAVPPPGRCVGESSPRARPSRPWLAVRHRA